MDKLIPKIIIGFLIMAYVTVYGKDDMNNNQSDFDYVKYGTCLGECTGYCVRSAQISESKINFEKSGSNLESSLPKILISETIRADYWIQLVGTIDFENFLLLDSIIGNPDCADGGIEWIEIKKKNKIYKVTFEYGNEPETLKSFIGYLRTYLNSFEIDSLEVVNFNERTLINKAGKIKNFFCSRGCSQYLIELIENNETTYYFDKYLDSKYHKDGLSISFNGVLQYDSTIIYKPSPNDIPAPDFKVKNIRMFNINIKSD